MVLFRESLAQWAPERRDGSVNENGEYSMMRGYENECER